jgi:leader peptidase (prepilin peptidase) / N-methyltransferase
MEPQPILFGSLLFVFGAVVGSFLNVVIGRLPAGESIVRPRSKCPSCGHPIRWYDNIPIASFFILKRRCRDCGHPISWRYPCVEALAAGLLLALWGRFGLSIGLPVHFLFCAVLIAITFIDIDHRIIPNELSLPGIAVGFAASFLWPGMWKESLWGLALGGGVLLLVSLAYEWIRKREGMGMGDVKLLAMLGAWLGVRSLLFILLFASLQGVLAALLLWVFGAPLKPPMPEEGEDGESPGTVPQEAEPAEASPAPFLQAAIPFGPFLSLAAVEYLFFAEKFLNFISGNF